jgi:dihydrofolate synthase/folylpolyglutamate synthase
LAQVKNLEGDAYKSITEAIHAAKSKAHINDLIFIGGSTFVVAEALEYFV